jgi:hypothetical protein
VTPSLRLVLTAALASIALPAAAISPKQPPGGLREREFFRPELVITTAHVPIGEALSGLPNREAWRRFAMQAAVVDPRSGAATGIVGVFPVPGGRAAHA